MKRLLDAVVFDWGGTLSVHADVDLADLWRHAAAASIRVGRTSWLRCSLA